MVLALALASVTVNKGLETLSSGPAVFGRNQRQRATVISSVPVRAHLGRRGFLLSFPLASSITATSKDNDSRTTLIQKYLKKSEENKAKNDKERLDGYYKRNYKDYFEFIEGSIKAKKGQLSESEKGILDWLQSNK